MSNPASIMSLHGPNSKFADFRTDPESAQPAGEAAAWATIAASEALWLKLLFPDHSPHDAAVAKQRGLKVILRAPGEGYVHWEDVLTMIARFAGMIDVIEVGNEPAHTPGDDNPLSLWNHAWYLEQVWLRCHQPAAAHGITLCTPGWRNQEAFGAGLQGPLVERLREVYRLYDAIGVHVYDPYRLSFPHEQLVELQKADPAWVPPLSRVDGWVQAFADRPRDYHITEAGIATAVLAGCADKAASDIVKADRYYDFLGDMALNLPRVRSVSFFILGGTNDFAAFSGGGYDPNGVNSYWLAPAAWSHLGQRLRF